MSCLLKDSARGGWTSTVVSSLVGVLLLFHAAALRAGMTGHVPDRVLLKLKAGVTENEAKGLISSQGANQAQTIPHLGVRVLKVPPSALSKVLDALNHDPKVEFAEPDAIFEPDFTPNDPYFSSQWHLARIAAPAAWDTTAGTSNVIVAILDTGVDGTHPDLAPNLVPGWNTYDNNSNTADVEGHGTEVAGTAAAAGNNGIGVASVAFNCSIMPVRVSDLSGGGYVSTIASGLTWAADHGARVANISYEVTGYQTISSAAKYFDSKGGVVTVSAGNYSTALTIPDDPDLLTVSATDSNDALASWSNTGTPIDLAAPGVGIYTTTMGGGYGSVSGTSLSAPVAAGVAALVISANPSLSSAQVQQVLKQSADDLGAPGWDPVYGWGRVNAQKAVSLAATFGQGTGGINPPVITSQPAPLALAAGAEATFSVTAFGSAPLKYQWFLNGMSIPGATDSSYTQTNVQALDTGSYSVQVANVAGTVLSSNASLTVNNPPVLAPINDQIIYAGTTLLLTIVASDTNVPAQTLTFSLDPGSPAGAVIGPATGIFAWNTTAAQAGTTNPVTVRVTENGVPSLSAVRSFNIIVTAPLSVQIPTVVDGIMTLTWNSIPGTTYRVEYKISLSDSAWNPLAPDVVASGPAAAATDPVAAGQRYYRVEVVQ